MKLSCGCHAGSLVQGNSLYRQIRYEAKKEQHLIKNLKPLISQTQSLFSSGPYYVPQIPNATSGMGIQILGEITPPCGGFSTGRKVTVEQM